MKLNKKMMAINLLATILLTDVAMAGRIPTTRKPSADGSSSGQRTGSSTKTTQQSQADVQTIEATPESCSMDQDSQTYFPLSLFDSLVKQPGDVVDIQVRPNNKIVVKIPPVYTGCGEFIPVIQQDKVTKNVTVLMKLVRKQEVTNEKLVVKIPDINMTHKTLQECLLTEKKVLVDNSMDFSKVPGKDFSESTSTFDYDFDKSKDFKKTVTVSYGYPKAYHGDYDTKYGFETRPATVPGNNCMLSEKIAENSTYINEGRDVLIEKINAACSSGDSQKIADARRSLGNADALRDIAAKIGSELDAAYIATVMKTDVDRISSEMTTIEDNLSKNRDTITEAQAKKKVARYAELADELNTKFLNPAIYRLKELMEKREGITADDESPVIKKIDEEITKLNTDIGKFSKRPEPSLNTLYHTMAKFGLTNSAKTIEDIRLKSALYSEVRMTQEPGQNKPLTFESANQKQVKAARDFDKTLKMWTNVYQVGQGNMLPLKMAERERQGAIDRMNSRYASFEKTEMENYYNYCTPGMLGGVKNGVRCNEFINGRQRRLNVELKKRGKDLDYVKSKDNELSRMAMSYNEYQINQALKERQEADVYDPTGASHSSYEDTYSERFPGYSLPTSTTAYDASMYDMGVLGRSMSMGQPAMNLSQQQQFIGLPNYQFQLPRQQQQNNGWPSL